MKTKPIILDEKVELAIQEFFYRTSGPRILAEEKEANAKRRMNIEHKKAISDNRNKSSSA